MQSTNTMQNKDMADNKANEEQSIDVHSGELIGATYGIDVHTIVSKYGVVRDRSVSLSMGKGGWVGVVPCGWPLWKDPFSEEGRRSGVVVRSMGGLGGSLYSSISGREGVKAFISSVEDNTVRGGKWDTAGELFGQASSEGGEEVGNRWRGLVALGGTMGGVVGWRREVWVEAFTYACDILDKVMEGTEKRITWRRFTEAEKAGKREWMKKMLLDRLMLAWVVKRYGVEAVVVLDGVEGVGVDRELVAGGDFQLLDCPPAFMAWDGWKVWWNTVVVEFILRPDEIPLPARRR